ncbi:MAG TPA: sterol desaturase family protein [Planctomycetaceae bacterium]|nr:sterol desaturase family protein [Planctomycetaceae bacterium]
MEGIIRLTCFLTVLTAVALAELLAPRRKLSVRKGLRWRSHFLLAGLNTAAVRLLSPLTAVATAALGEERNWGLLNHLQWPAWIKILITLVALDFIVYLQHVAFHAMPILWQLHRVHHADLDFDVTTGIRFHTFEMILSGWLKAAAVVALGAPALGVVAFEIVLNATSMFNHGNLRLPAKLDAALRWFIVTPDMHRVHHSIETDELNRNFGFNLPWWDYLLGTYRSQPARGHNEMTIGLSEFRDEEVDRLGVILTLPFVGSKWRTRQDEDESIQREAEGTPAANSLPRE